MEIGNLGKFKDRQQGNIVSAFKLTQKPAEWDKESKAEVEVATISQSLDVGVNASGEAGLWSTADFSKRFAEIL